MRTLDTAGRYSRLASCAAAVVLLSSMGGTRPAAAAQRAVCSAGELNDAIKAAKPGDEIVLCARSWKDTNIVFDVNGTASAPITLKAEVPGKVVMEGSSTLRMGGSYAVVDGLVWTGRYTGSASRIIEFRIDEDRLCNNCRLTNSAMIDYNPSDVSKSHIWVSMWGQHNRVDHNYFSGKTSVGTLLQVPRNGNRPDHARIDHNFFSRPKLHQSNGGESVQVGPSGEYAESDSLTTVEANYFYKADGEIEIISNKSSGNTYTRNTFVGSRGMLTLRQGNRVLIEGNYFFGDGQELTGGIMVYGQSHTIINNYFEGLNPAGSQHRGAVALGMGDAKIDPSRGFYHYPRVKDVLIAHNTIVGSVNSVYFYLPAADYSTVPPENIVVSNNIVSNPSKPLVVEAVKPKNVVYEGNIFDGPRPNVDAAMNIFGPADLLKGVDDVLRVAAGSKVIGAAVPIAKVTADIDGSERDSAPDIGADEYHDPDDYRAPVRLCDVGPVSFQPGLKSSCEVRRRPRPPASVSASTS